MGGRDHGRENRAPVYGLIRDKIISYLFEQLRNLTSTLPLLSSRISSTICWPAPIFPITLIPLLSSYFEEDEEEGLRPPSSTGLPCSLPSLPSSHGGGPAGPPRRPGTHREEALTRPAFFLRIILPAQVCFLLPVRLWPCCIFASSSGAGPGTLVYNGMIIPGAFCCAAEAWRGSVRPPWCLSRIFAPAKSQERGEFKLRPAFYHPAQALSAPGVALMLGLRS